MKIKKIPYSKMDVEKNYCMDCHLELIRVAQIKNQPESITTLEGCPHCGLFTFKDKEDGKYYWNKTEPTNLILVN